MTRPQQRLAATLGEWNRLEDVHLAKVRESIATLAAHCRSLTTAAREAQQALDALRESAGKFDVLDKVGKGEP